MAGDIESIAATSVAPPDTTAKKRMRSWFGDPGFKMSPPFPRRQRGIVATT
jgi:hypothetical protein